MADIKFGPGQIGNTTPRWANRAFQLTVILTTAATVIIAGSSRIPNADKVEIGLYLKVLDSVVLAVAKMFGVQISDETKVPAGKVDVMETK